MARTHGALLVVIVVIWTYRVKITIKRR
jgi:hypothetical protein